MQSTATDVTISPGSEQVPSMKVTAVLNFRLTALTGDVNTTTYPDMAEVVANYLAHLLGLSSAEAAYKSFETPPRFSSLRCKTPDNRLYSHLICSPPRLLSIPSQVAPGLIEVMPESALSVEAGFSSGQSPVGGTLPAAMSERLAGPGPNICWSPTDSRLHDAGVASASAQPPPSSGFSFGNSSISSGICNPFITSTAGRSPRNIFSFGTSPRESDSGDVNVISTAWQAHGSKSMFGASQGGESG